MASLASRQPADRSAHTQRVGRALEGWCHGGCRVSAQDYTLFEPANTAYTLSDPTKWQPLVIEDVPPYGGGGVGVPLPSIDLC